MSDIQLGSDYVIEEDANNDLLIKNGSGTVVLQISKSADADEIIIPQFNTDQLDGGLSVNALTNLEGNRLSVDGSGNLDSTHTAVSKDGTTVLSDVDDINFTDANDATVTVTDDTDGSVSVDVDVSTIDRADVSDDGSLVLSGPSDINFATNLSVVDDGDGTVTVAATDTRTDVSDGGTTVVSDTTDINAGNGLTATDDGDGTATLARDGTSGVTNRNENTLSDGGKEQLLNTASVTADVTVIDETNDEVGTWFLRGSNNDAQKLFDSNKHFTNTEGNSGTVNVYWDSGNTRYEVENQTGAQITVAAIDVRET